MKYTDDSKAYGFAASDMRNLEAIRQRLYSPIALLGDERRDLANTLDAIMGKAMEIDIEEYDGKET